jgi:hypothetical protein
MHGLTKRKTLAVVGVIAVLATAGAAFAYWTGGGGGSGSATVGTNGNVTLIATVPAGIAPGTAKPVTFTAANATTSPIFITTVHLVSVVADSDHPGCIVSPSLYGDFSMADVGESHQVPANATVDPLPTAGSLVYANTAVNQDACKDATLTLTLSST